VEYFEIREKKNKIESLKERIVRLRSSIEFGERMMGGGASSAEKDKLSRKMAQLLTLENELMEETGRIEIMIRVVENDIDSLPENMRRVVRLRDIDCNTWYRVSKKAHYSQSHCRKLHADAIQALKVKHK
jgi:hypothetical protein